MKSIAINPNAPPDAVVPPVVIPANGGIQPNKASGFRVEPGMTTMGFAVLRANQLAEARMMHQVRMTISPEVPGVKLA
jgi:hypothetical protein